MKVLTANKLLLASALLFIIALFLPMCPGDGLPIATVFPDKLISLIFSPSVYIPLAVGAIYLLSKLHNKVLKIILISIISIPTLLISLFFGVAAIGMPCGFDADQPQSISIGAIAVIAASVILLMGIIKKLIEISKK